MKFGFSLLLITAVTGAAFAQTATHAATLPAKRTVESAVTRANFFVDHKKDKHAHIVRKHGYPHEHAYLKKPPQKKH